ncbi:hypothetical protein OG548_14505 [Streptomyces sp. NBC_01356]|uniref:hypothetical protein n=1 Tax=Streptomyces sp. NBC_01356 TaxID=2903836 RepID=UPI002E341F3E|nr:hypothetical protein [Streptomyces sp. NBC_01356]
MTRQLARIGAAVGLLLAASFTAVAIATVPDSHTAVTADTAWISPTDVTSETPSPEATETATATLLDTAW